MSGYWIRLAGRLGAGALASERSHVPLDAALGRLLGCRWIWWAPDPLSAWTAVFSALAGDRERRLIYAVGAPPWLECAAAGFPTLRGTEVDGCEVKRRTWSPLFRELTHGDVLILEHRHGLPVAPETAPDDVLILEDATAAVGGAVGNRPVGSLGHAAVITLGVPPFTRSTGALVATPNRHSAGRLSGQPMLTPVEQVNDTAIIADVAGVEEWVAECRAVAAIYDSVWRGDGLPIRPVEPVGEIAPTFVEYLIAVPDPDALSHSLAGEGIETRRPLNDRLRGLLSDPSCDELPRAREFYSHALQLPSHPGLDFEEVLAVAAAVVRHVRAG
ncbi:MAG: hypothetical protein ACT4P5_19360 [Armatimonadota bacterium]